MSNDVAVRESEALEAYEVAERALVEENQATADASDFQIPLLKIGQPLTQEVADGDAVPGEFINSLTQQGLGREVEFVVAAHSKGRFDHGDRDEGTRARKAYGAKNVPWRDDPFFAKPFSEHPDAEEQYSARANSGEIKWGRGPRISTTYDFYGHVISGLGPDEEPIPVCLSLMRMNTRQAKKWLTLLDAVLRGRYWDAVFTLTTEQQRNDQGNYYTINVRQSRKTTPEERQRAVNLALVVKRQNIAVVGEDDDAKPATEPDSAGGLKV